MFLKRNFPKIACIGLLLIFQGVILGQILFVRSDVYAESREQIGGERPIYMARATWDTGWFQAEIYRQLLQELGYKVERPRTFDNDSFYKAVARGEVDFWVNGWFPLHDSFLTEDVAAHIDIVGTQVRGGALQGYLVDRQSAETFNITTLADFTRPDVVTHFDRDGNGRADLIGCNRGWGCEPIVNHHLESYKLLATVDHVQGDYGPLMVDTVTRYEKGQPIFFYTWTPNWTIGALEPGQDVVWIGVPFPSLPNQDVSIEEITIDVIGCAAEPCTMGFPPNDIRAVANSEFLRINPAVRALLQVVEVPLDDIAAQNALLLAGEELQIDIERHAANWIAENRTRVSHWLAEAAANHDDTLAQEARQEDSANLITDFPTIRVATKPLAPFVIYDVDSREYTGFSIELWKMIAREAGLEYELYGVNTLASLLDEVERGAADVATSGIGITAERETTLDFSHAYFESGLQILVPVQSRGLWGDDMVMLARAIFSPQVIEVLGILLVCLLIAAHVMWFSERHINEDFAETYWPGIWEAFWWSAVTATTVGYGDKTPKTALGRLVGLLWMFSGLFVLASFTASIATTFAVNEFNAHISGPNDLAGKRVATIERSTAEEYLHSRGIQPILFKHEDDAYIALIAKEIDAFVYDAPVLQHYIALDENDEVALAGPVFQELQYGVALSHNHELREAINRALLRLVESGEYNALYLEWFGN